MEFTVRPEVKILYPSAHFGSLIIHNQNNQKKHQDLEKAKHQLEEKIRETYPQPAEDEVMRARQVLHRSSSLLLPFFEKHHHFPKDVENHQLNRLLNFEEHQLYHNLQFVP